MRYAFPFSRKEEYPVGEGETLMPLLTLTHGIALWFLVLSLFLPRLALFIGWLHAMAFPVPSPWSGVLWLFLPRVLVLLIIYGHQGLSPWFWIHLVVAIVVWTGSAGAARR